MIGQLLRAVFASVPRAGRERPCNSQDVTGAPQAILHGNAFIEVARCRHGLMAYNRHDMYIGRSLALYGEFSELEIELLQRLVRTGDFVIDAGANIGTHAVPLARSVGPQGVVIAYEPQRLVFEMLCTNVILNELPNVIPRQAAAGVESGLIKVPAIEPGREQNFGGLALGRWEHGESVSVERIDDLELPRCALIKADVEGMEADVVNGAAATIRRHRPCLYVENDRDDRSPALIATIRDLDYRLFWHLPPLFNPANHARSVTNVFGAVISANMLCVPAEGDFGVASGLREVSGPDDTWRG